MKTNCNIKRIGKHRYRAVGLAIVAAMAFSAVGAATASAFTWVTKSGGVETELPNGQEETVTPTIKPGNEFLLELTLGSTPVKIFAKKLIGVSTKIKQEGTSARDSGKLIFSELTLTEPPACAPPKSIATTELKSELVKAPALASDLADRFLPQSGEIFGSFKLGGSCAFSGTTLQLKTSNGLYAETEPLGSFKLEQPLRFSPTIEAKTGGNLFTGANPANLTGEGLNKLSGTLAGREWGGPIATVTDGSGIEPPRVGPRTGSCVTEISSTR